MLLPNRILLFLLFIFLPLIKLYATHVRAGEIVARRISTSSLQYEFTFTLYRDIGGVQVGPAALNFGDGTTSELIEAVEVNSIGNNTEEHIFKFVHTYSAPGSFVVSVQVQNRNAGVLNLASPSDQIPFFVQTTLLINPALGINSTPVLLNPPIDLGRVGQRFVHNPAAFDIDGDSLAYKITIPKEGPNSNARGYVDPILVPPAGRSEAGGAPIFSIDPLTGDLTWDSPSRAGEYNVAFVIEEWRGGVLIGQVVRDMQIIIRDNPNQRPMLEVPNDTCIVAGTLLNATVRATDPDNNPIRLTAISGILEAAFPQPRASFITPAAVQASPATGTFSWQTDCIHVRDEPYQVVFRAEDLPRIGTRDTINKLVDLKSWRIRVVAPRPTGLRASAEGRNVRLRWDTYNCTNASEMIIWRRVGCTPIDTSICNTGLDPSTGYVAIGRVPIGTTTFLDNNEGAGLDPGMEYSYRLTAGFAPPAGGESLASEEACTSLVLDVPFLTHVTVEATDSLQGEILVRWAQPRELNTATNPGPYRYELYRATGFTGTDYVQVMSRTLTSVTANNDTVFVDRGLNTAANPYNYLLLFYTAEGIRDSTASASSVRLTATPQVNAVELSWQAVVPWNNANTTHRVYRESSTLAGSFELIAEVAVGAEESFRYVDSGAGGLDADSTYCYYVDTYGSYNNQKIMAPLINRSQISCAVPIDTLKPCPPVLSIDTIDCGSLSAESDCNVSSYANKLTWSDASKAGEGCDTDIVAYRLYYKRYQEDEQFTLLATISSPTPPDTVFTHSNLSSYAGCYYVTAVDEDGDESEPSNTVCKDNCPYYELPNVITPNGDGKNDVFVPFDCPRFVESVKFTVYNRWGRPVFETTESIFINWDGRLAANGESAQGEELSTGVYYYLAEVRFTRLSRKDEKVHIKGWVHIVK